MNIENRNSLLAALSRDVNLFIGAGFSVLATDEDDKRLPVGSELADELVSYFKLEHLAGTPLQQLCTIISRDRRDQLIKFLVRRFTVKSFDPAYKCIEKLAIKNIFTTNIDDLIHGIFADSRKFYLNDVNINGPVYRDRLGIDLFMLHGSVLTPKRSFRFGAVEVASSFGADPDRWRYLRAQIKQHPTLFLGYSFSDAATLEAIAPQTAGGTASEAWILVRAPAKPGELEYFRALNLQIITGDVLDFLQFLLTDVSDAGTASGYSVRQTEVVFPGLSVPNPGKVLSRSIVDFFRGAPPTWSDVFSGQLCRTSHYPIVRDAIDAKKDIVITGMPASGKTTLLMQIAAEIDYPGHKIILDGTSEGEARLLVRRLGGESALVFIDNVAKDIDSMNVLTASPNVVVVAAERDYTLGTVSHRVNNLGNMVFDISGITAIDMQGCYDSIPESIRQWELLVPEMTASIKPSLYEFISLNVTGQTIQQRVRSALRSLRVDSPRLAEMLLFVAYVHACRTPVSMDMALAYWSGRIQDYSEVYSMVAEVGALLAEYEGDLATEPQDYFSARSLLAAETILDSAQGEFLKQVLISFHNNVSPMRICHYNAFRRNGYDSRLFDKAFSSWEEGMEFYEDIYEKVQSPYIRQQEALFLNGRGRYREAFFAIDKARSEAGDRNFTIKNSHAIVLFRANIGIEEAPGVRTELDKSMQILMDCYTSDRRKAFHALTFADHALRYWDRYPDAKGREYLVYAERWLEVQGRTEPWRLRDIDRLLAMVKKKL